MQASHALVIAGHPLATKLGMDVLTSGGNAVDAFVTVSLALNVAEPGNSGLGGKMVCLYYDAKTKKVSSIVAMDAAPLHQSVDKLTAVPAASRERGWIAVCTPGLAAGLGEMHHRWGTKPWADLVTPDAELAATGFKLDGNAGAMLSEFKPEVDKNAAAIYAPGGHLMQNGELLRNPDLAHTLQLLAKGGPDAFYHGEIAEKFIAGAQAGGSPLQMDDLASYKARVLEPVQGTYDGYTVYSSPPPLTGGTTLLTALDCLARTDMSTAHPRDATYITEISRVMQQIYPAINRSIGDVPGTSDKVAKLLSPDSIAGLTERADTADPQHPFAKAKHAAAPATAPSGFAPAPATLASAAVNDDGDQASTTHLIIIDKTGDIVCCTQSLGLHFGADVVAPGTGFLVNADIGNFSLMTPSSLNYFSPGKWPRSTMTPTMFFKEGKPFLVIGSPAGQRIPTAVLQVSLDVLKFNEPLQQAIEAPRFHIESNIAPNAYNKVDLESTNPEPLTPALQKLGWDVSRRDVKDFYFGCVNAAEFKPDGSLVGVADQRRTADAKGN